MIQIAWERLQSHGRLTNRYLLADEGLNVERSSFVCALLARLAGQSSDVDTPDRARASLGGAALVGGLVPAGSRRRGVNG
jgi:hypothetical protein